jgi:hypothetical protein
MKKYNCIIFDFNKKSFVEYDIMPYFMRVYEHSKESFNNLEDCKKFILKWGQYQFWSRCEYEVILKDWPNGCKESKIDVFWQIKINIDIISEIFLHNINEKIKKAQ